MRDPDWHNPDDSPSEWELPEQLERIADALEKLVEQGANQRIVILPVADGPLDREALDALAEAFRGAMGGEE